MARSAATVSTVRRRRGGGTSPAGSWSPSECDRFCRGSAGSDGSPG